mmetsp:Transcript_7004/g.20326  ORF Transcript_7004/g.20326 Transcript_7004/m.20326 type:complete len:516 (+) Transcript_7004:1009-2556(+)
MQKKERNSKDRIEIPYVANFESLSYQWNQFLALRCIALLKETHSLFLRSNLCGSWIVGISQTSIQCHLRNTPVSCSNPVRTHSKPSDESGLGQNSRHVALEGNGDHKVFLPRFRWRIPFRPRLPGAFRFASATIARHHNGPGHLHGSLSVHRIVAEPALVHGAVRKEYGSPSLPAAVAEGPLVPLAVGVNGGSASLHSVVDPLAVVQKAVRLFEESLAVALAVLPDAVVQAQVGPGKDTVAVHDPVPPLAVVDGTVRQKVRPGAVAQVLAELANVPRSGLERVGGSVVVGSPALHPAAFPFSLVDDLFAVRGHEPSVSVFLVAFPLSLVEGSVGKETDSSSLPLAVDHFTLVNDVLGPGLVHCSGRSVAAARGAGATTRLLILLLMLILLLILLMILILLTLLLILLLILLLLLLRGSIHVLPLVVEEMGGPPSGFLGVPHRRKVDVGGPVLGRGCTGGRLGPLLEANGTATATTGASRSGSFLGAGPGHRRGGSVGIRLGRENEPRLGQRRRRR